MVGHTILRQQQTVLCGTTLPSRGPSRSVPGRRCIVTVKAEQEQSLDRRAALSMLAGVATLVNTQPSQAAFGDAANVFGKATNQSGYFPVKGPGFTLEMPSKWTPSKEKEYPGLVLRWEDTQDVVNNVVVFKLQGKGNVGDAASFIKSNAYLFGENVWKGNTISEGGFKKDQVSSANLISSYTDKKDGKEYTRIELLTRAADGNEGGRHQLISAASSGGDLLVCKVQIGDKRWFRGAGRAGKGLLDSFSVA